MWDTDYSLAFNLLRVKVRSTITNSLDVYFHTLLGTNAKYVQFSRLKTSCANSKLCQMRHSMGAM